MAYGTVKVDNVTFTYNSADATTTFSGFYASTTNNLTLSGTASAATFTGTTANFTNVNAQNISVTTALSGLSITGGTASFTSGVFTNISGTTATFTSGIIASGTAALPSLAILSDPNTGIFSPGADQLAVATNGVERVKFGTSEVVFNDGGTDYDFRVEGDTNANLLFVDASTDRVGVGTTTVDNRCHIATSEATTQYQPVLRLETTSTGDFGPALLFEGNRNSISGTASIGIDTSASGKSSLVYTADSIHRWIGNDKTSEFARITSAGLVGIGTASPSVLTHLSTSTDTQLRVESTSASSANEAAVQLIRGSNQSAIKNKAGGLEFFVQGLTNEVARLDSSGRLGIGTSSPSTNTEINAALDTGASLALNEGQLSIGREANSGGAVRIGYDTTNNFGFISSGRVGTSWDKLILNAGGGNVGIGTTTPVSILDVTVGGSGTRKFVANYDDSVITIKGSNDSSNPETLRLVADNLRFSTGTSGSGTERARIDSSGRLGIGTSDPTSGSSSYYDDLVVRNATSGTGAGITIQSNSTDGFSGLNLRKADGTDLGKFVTDSSNGKLYIETAGSAAITVDSSQRVGIGVTTPDQKLVVSGSLAATGAGSFGAGNIAGAYLSYESGGEARVFARSVGTASDLSFWTSTAGGSSERARIDSSGRLLVGTTIARVIEPYGLGADGQTAHTYESVADTSPGPGLALCSNSTTARMGPYLYFSRSGAASVGSNTVVVNGDNLGTISFAGADGTDVRTRGAAIYAEVDGTPGANDMPGRLVFSTTADGAASPTEQMRIGNQGTVFFGTTAEVPSTANVVGATFYRREGLLSITRDGGEALSVNRKTSDGNLVVFHQDGTVEGTITVSGTTVSYNGAHLSRWSQLPSGVERTEILRGSVLSNIDEMCEWGDEDNEQLNRMKVSDVEGDKNVSGVFQAWDDDDDTYTNDFYCAMTGDFIIRIAGDVTVERGDLLMSAGDGTAKPQDDDIIRSKTIAKVTSVNVSCTYEDGSYCVPCVLMAC